MIHDVAWPDLMTLENRRDETESLIAAARRAGKTTQAANLQIRLLSYQRDIHEMCKHTLESVRAAGHVEGSGYEWMCECGEAGTRPTRLTATRAHMSHVQNAVWGV